MLEFMQLQGVGSPGAVPVAEAAEAEWLQALVQKHHALTRSAKAAALLKDWPAALAGADPSAPQMRPAALHPCAVLGMFHQA